jgi:hypothetical protein
MSFERDKLSVTKSARTLALCGNHSNYTFEQAGSNTETTLKSTGDGQYAHASVITGKFKC